MTTSTFIKVKSRDKPTNMKKSTESSEIGNQSMNGKSLSKTTILLLMKNKYRWDHKSIQFLIISVQSNSKLFHISNKSSNF
jgi:hypothetical protein